MAAEEEGREGDTWFGYLGKRRVGIKGEREDSRAYYEQEDVIELKYRSATRRRTRCRITSRLRRKL